MTRTYYHLTLSMWMIVVTLVLAILCIAGATRAASLQICYVDPLPNPDIATAPAFVNGDPLWPDLFVNSTSSSAGRCSIIPIPATIVRGTDQSVTMKYMNTLGEVSAPSNGKSFRLPLAPPVPVVNSVAIVAP